MMWLRRLLAAPLASAFLPVLLLALMVFRLNDVLSSPEFLKEQIRRDDVHRFLVREAAPNLILDALGGELPADAPVVLTREDLADIAEAAIPAPWFRQTVGEVLDAVFPYIRGTTDSFVVEIGLRERTELALAEIVARMEPAESQAFAAALDSMPESVILTEQTFPEELRGDEGFAQRREIFAALAMAAGALAGLAAVLWLLSSLLGGRGVKGKLRWGGILVAVGAALILALVSVAPEAMRQGLTEMASATAENLPRAPVGDLIGPMLEAFLRPVGDQARLLLGLGGVLFVGSFLPVFRPRG